jgi:hypothetical protein
MTEHDADAQATFERGVKALAAGDPSTAIAELESLADRGVIDATASYDRGLAYAMRVREGGERAGDLGRAAHGFEEARALAADDGLRADATRALAAVRAEVARRRARAGDPVELEPSVSPWIDVVQALPEDVWASTTALGSLSFGVALALRWRSASRRVRAGGAIVAALAAVLFFVGAIATLTARRERHERSEAVVVVPQLRLADANGVVRQGGSALPEGATVRVVDRSGSLARVRWGAMDGWAPLSSIRSVARVER